MSLPIVNNSYIFIKNWWELDLTPELLERQLDVRHWSYRSTRAPSRTKSMGLLQPRVVAEHMSLHSRFILKYVCGEKLVALTIAEM
jgi:hypothetical protein